MKKDGSVVSISKILGDAPISVNGEDMNNIKSTGFYQGYNMTNSAVKTISAFIVVGYSSDWVAQMQLVMRPVSQSELWIRHFYNGTTWGSWQRVY